MGHADLSFSESPCSWCCHACCRARRCPGGCGPGVPEWRTGMVVTPACVRARAKRVDHSHDLARMEPALGRAVVPQRGVSLCTRLLIELVSLPNYPRVGMPTV